MSPSKFDEQEAAVPVNEEAAASIEQLPPRLVKHAARRSRKVRYYAICFLWLFILLTLTLIIWGYRQT